ncbi:succinyldiaminopimelate transaminase [Propioniciclava sinopodophylli]|uniref:Aminotransferase n=1 Tax=Propioniciclava sinopodophylli TaxID=1837344 RepID=A0A4Q9KG48_9ACTN|nr:succinyldiaminopimelate transaminase [Propioniciclava sinopodophylli]TBT87399.1 succinyldiaminopimelate transaminase [Propioniciclava sinopodophylli]
MTGLSGRLPDFPWDTIAGARDRARAHPDGICDLSVGTPVDPVPQLALDALAASASGWAGYPTVWGTPALREAIRGYLEGRWSSVPLEDANVLPVIGTKELVAHLPLQLGVGPGDTVVIPTTAYPTYEVGARIAGAEVLATDDPVEAAAARPRLIWINSPANPHGAILGADALRAWVDAARSVGAVLASDECYGEFGWDVEPVSVLHPDVCGGTPEGLIAAHSLSKRSNVAGYRAGFLAGCSSLLGELLEVRKHSGLMVPGPVQDAMVALLGDHDHVAEQRGRYLARRAVLKPALEAAGFRIDHSEGSLYLWATRGEDCRATVDWLAERGILAAPGDFYGAASGRHVRIALTASDERIAAAGSRLG